MPINTVIEKKLMNIEFCCSDKIKVIDAENLKKKKTFHPTNPNQCDNIFFCSLQNKVLIAKTFYSKMKAKSLLSG